VLNLFRLPGETGHWILQQLHGELFQELTPLLPPSTLRFLWKKLHLSNLPRHRFSTL